MSRKGKWQTNRSQPSALWGLTGFLITSVDEVKSYFEMRNIFEEYYEQIYKVNDSKPKEETSVEDDLESELERLRKDRPFRQVNTHCKNSVFINIIKEFSHVDPVAIVDKFFLELVEKREPKTSNTFKVLPILDTFRNSESCARESVQNILKTRFENDSEPRKYFIEFQARGNYKLNPEDKQKIVEGVADTVTKVKTNWTVDRENADYILVLVSLKNVCCVTFLKDYFKRRKYNVIELYKEFDPETKTDKPIQEANEK